MSKSDRLKLTTTSVRSLTPGEVGQVAGGDGGPGGNTSLSNAYCGACASNNNCDTRYNCPPPSPTPTTPTPVPYTAVCYTNNGCPSFDGCTNPGMTKGGCPR
jgi:hypothetical protein